MADVTFDTAWFLPDENKWRDLKLLAFKDRGILIVHETSLEFRGMKNALTISNIRSISYGRQGRDFVNKWVKVEYVDGATPCTAFFADGSLLGWGGIFGGTKRILNEVKRLPIAS